MKTFLIGRDKTCDIQLGGKTVAPYHAEIVITDAKRVYLTDRASQNGTFVWREDEWVRLRQGFIRPDDRVRFGEDEVGGSELVRLLQRAKTPNAGVHVSGGGGGGASSTEVGDARGNVIAGAVRRNEFGEPVSRE